jgi:hypothetical protein
MTVSWRSEFNGGDLQIFSVLWWKESENETVYGERRKRIHNHIHYMYKTLHRKPTMEKYEAN